MKRKVNELYKFVKIKNNIHIRIKQLVTSMKSAVSVAERGQEDLRIRAEKSLFGIDPGECNRRFTRDA